LAHTGLSAPNSQPRRKTPGRRSRLLCLNPGALRADGGIVSQTVAGHRRWMVRNFALTFAAVTLRVYLVVFGNTIG